MYVHKNSSTMYYFNYLSCFLLYVTYFHVVIAGDLSYYDTFTGEPITLAEYEKTVEKNTTFWCTGSIKSCNASEGRRMDLSCSSLRYPNRGCPHTPYSRDLPPLFGKDYEPVKTKSGKDMEPARKVRMTVLAEGDIPDQNFTILFVHFMTFTLENQVSIHDPLNYVMWTPTCCKPEGKNESICAPQEVPEDDTVHRFSGIRCMNLTKPLTYQNVGCLANKSSTPERINSATNFFDLSHVYGFDNSFRVFKDGLIKVDIENGKIWPEAKTDSGYCAQNVPPRETRCHKRDSLNNLLPVNFMGIMFWRQHNFIAKELKKVNPCWDDEKIFTLARDLNIAYFAQIFYYEVLPPFMGRQNLESKGLLLKDGEFRDNSGEDEKPLISLEYMYVMRWGHTMLPGMLHLYDDGGNYLKKFPICNMTLRTGFVSLDDNYKGMTEGSFRQAAGKLDHVVDPLVAELGLGNLQQAFDLPMADLAKAGLMGIASYIDFRSLCTGKHYKSFSDLSDDMEPEYIEILKRIYEDVADIPLIVGVWLEKSIPGGFAPRTLYCIAVRQLKKYIQYDRHWYEKQNRPNAFTARQLAEVRKITIARVLCDNGDDIKRITPNAFLREGPGNQIVDCSNIPKINFDVWKDDSC